MQEIYRHGNLKVLTKQFSGGIYQIKVKDNNVEQALRVLKENYKEMVSLR